MANPSTHGRGSSSVDSSGARKKKAKSDAGSNAAVAASPTQDGPVEGQELKSNGVDGNVESAYVKELQKFVNYV